MISKKTAIVLGAGAHVSYGFPTGAQLKTQIVKEVNQLAEPSSGESMRLLHSHGVAEAAEVEPEVCRNFAHALQHSGQPSIDAFIDANRHMRGYAKLSKAAIARILLRIENSERKDSSDDWLVYLFQVMLEGANSPEKLIESNPITFVTFNYDRFLETWLLSRIRYSFGLDPAEALAVLRQIPIHHVYGQLGEFPPSDQERNRPHPWVIASTGIRTIFEAEAQDAEVSAAREAISASEQVLLLGFGFHSENIQIIGLDHPKVPPVDATRFNLNDNELRRLLGPFKHFWPLSSRSRASSSTKCLGFLRAVASF